MFVDSEFYSGVLVPFMFIAVTLATQIAHVFFNSQYSSDLTIAWHDEDRNRSHHRIFRQYRRRP